MSDCTYSSKKFPIKPVNTRVRAIYQFPIQILFSGFSGKCTWCLDVTKFYDSALLTRLLYPHRHVCTVLYTQVGLSNECSSAFEWSALNELMTCLAGNELVTK